MACSCRPVLVVCGSGCGSATFCGRLHHAVNECVVVGAWPAWSGQWAVVGNEDTVNFFLLANVGALLGVWGIMSLFACPFWWCRHVVCVWWLLLGWGGV